MNEKILRFLNLKAEESRVAFSLWLLIAVNTLVLELSDVIATAGFVNNLGIEKVPWLWIVTTLLTMFAVGGYLVVIDRYPRLDFVTWLLIGLAVFYLLLEFMFAFEVGDYFTYPTLYLLADQQFMIMPLAFWALANDVYAVSDSKRVFPFIASGAVIGGLIGNGVAAWVTYLAEKYAFGLSQIFTAVAIILILSALFLRVTFLKTPVKTRQSREQDNKLRDTVNIGLDYFLNIPVFKAVGILMLLTGVILTLIEFNFLYFIDSTVNTDLEFQRFLGYYKAIQTSGLLMFQWLITSRLLTRIHLKKAFSVLPFAMFIAGGLAMGISNLIGAALARFAARTVYTGWDDSARKTLQGLVPDERRGRISAFMDSYFITSATVIGCILLLMLFGLQSIGVITEQAIRWIYLGVVAAAAVLAILTSFNLWKVYDASMLNFRLARSKRKSMLDGIEF